MLLALVLLGTSGQANSQQPPPSGPQSNSPPKSEGGRPQPEAQRDQRGTEKSPLIVKQLPSPKNPEEAARKAQEKEDKAASDWWLVRLTAILGLIGFFQLIVFGIQAAMLRKTIKTMDVTAGLQLRAYLSVVIGGAVYQEREKNLRFEAKPVLLNTGQTPAHNVGFRAKAAIMNLPLPDDFAFPLPEKISGAANLGPNQRFILSAIVDEFIDDAEVENIKAVNLPKALCAWGVVTYEDAFGKGHYTEFCHIISWLPNGDIWGNHTQRHNQAT